MNQLEDERELSNHKENLTQYIKEVNVVEIILRLHRCFALLRIKHSAVQHKHYPQEPFNKSNLNTLALKSTIIGVSPGRLGLSQIVLDFYRRLSNKF